MRRQFFVFLLIFSCFAKASFANISVSPFSVIFDAGTNKRAAEVRVTNTTGNTQTYRISFVNYRQKRDGSLELIETEDPKSPFASPYLSFSPRQPTLKSRETQIIRIARKPMVGIPDGEYVSHLKIQEITTPDAAQPANADKKTLQIDLRALYSVTIPVIIRKGSLESSGSLEKISKLPSKADLPERLSVIVGREGSRSFLGNIVVMEGRKEVGKLNNVRIYATLKEREVVFPLTEKAESLTGKILTVILNDTETNQPLTEKKFKF